jgi:DNA-binding response OmpR family regulator
MAKRRKQILLMEDNREIRGAFIALFTNSEDVTSFAVSGIPEALGMACREVFDAAVVDLGNRAEVADRLEMIRTWRRDGHLFPVIVTCANDYEGLSETVFAAGGDDFLRKPFLFGDLKARLQRQLQRGTATPFQLPRRIDGVIVTDSMFTFAGATIHPDLTIHFPTAEKMRLSAKQVAILRLFAEHAGKLLFKDTLLFGVWGADANPDSLTLHQYLYVLRKIYHTGGIELNQFVVLVRSSGWRISADAVLPREVLAHGN